MYEHGKRTTDLDKIRNGMLFTWGKVLEIIDVGEYTIIRYIPKPSGNIVSVQPMPECFHGYIAGKDTNRSSCTLDGILVACIALKHDGLNSQASHYFLRMIDAPTDE